jgi:hypothetical protein
MTLINANRLLRIESKVAGASRLAKNTKHLSQRVVLILILLDSLICVISLEAVLWLYIIRTEYPLITLIFEIF